MDNRKLFLSLLAVLLIGCGETSSFSSSLKPGEYDESLFKPYKESLVSTKIEDEKAYTDEEGTDIVIQNELSSNKGDKVSFLQINDTHGAIYDDNDVIGMSRISSVMNEYQKENGDYIGVLGGDIFQGGWLSNITRGSAFVDVLNNMNFNAYVIGNHEFDWGLEEIAKFKDGNLENGELNIPFLGANIYYSNSDKHPSWIDPYTVVNSNGYKVGIIGIIGEGQYDSISSSQSANYAFKNTNLVIERSYAELINKYKCDSVVLATHDYSQTFNTRIAENKNIKIDAIFNAHTHEYIEEYVIRHDGYNIPCIQSNTKNGNLGSISYLPGDISNKPKMKHYAPLQYAKDEKIESIISKYQDIINAGTEKLGYTVNALDKREIGITVSKYMTEKYHVLGSFVNSSGVRGTISAGEINRSKCYEVFPFDNIVYIVKVPGNTARKLLTSSSYFSYQDPEQVIMMSEYYYLAVIDFLYTRDSNEFHFKDTIYYDTKTLMRDDFVECCQKYYN